MGCLGCISFCVGSQCFSLDSTVPRSSLGQRNGSSWRRCGNCALTHCPVAAASLCSSSFVCPHEDPLTSGEYGARFVKAMQARSADGRTLRVTAAPKHYLNYDMEGRKDSWQSDWGPSRNDFNAIVSKQEQVEYYLAQFHRMMTVGQPGACDSLPLSTPQLQHFNSAI
jgi:hypothetical protein